MIKTIITTKTTTNKVGILDYVGDLLEVHESNYNTNDNIHKNIIDNRITRTTTKTTSTTATIKRKTRTGFLGRGKGPTETHNRLICAKVCTCTITSAIY